MATSTRHIPERTCVSCRQTRPKRELIRIVGQVEGSAVVDSTGRLPGRGAYLCNNKACWEEALRRRSLDRALKSPLDAAARESLLTYSQALVSSSSGAVSSGTGTRVH